MEMVEQHRLGYEERLALNPADGEAVHFLAMWYFERQCYEQVCSNINVLVKIYLMIHFISSIRHDDTSVIL